MWLRKRNARSPESVYEMYADVLAHKAISAEVLLMTNKELLAFLDSDHKYSSIAAIELVRRANEYDQMLARYRAENERADLMLDDVYSLITVGEVS